MTNPSQFFWGQPQDDPTFIGSSLRYDGTNWLVSVDTTTVPDDDCTYSCWYRQSNTDIDNNNLLRFGQQSGNSGYAAVMFNGMSDPASEARSPVGRSLDGASFYKYYGPNVSCVDANGWYHIFWRSKRDSGTGNLEFNLWINGIEMPNKLQQTGFTNHPAGIILGNSSFDIPDEEIQGYYTEVFFVDGQYLQPTDVANFDSRGVWVPKADEQISETITQGGGYGPMGFELIMAPEYFSFDGTNWILQDQSGQGNNFVAKNFELGDPTDVDYDVMTDSPSQVFSIGSFWTGPCVNPQYGNDFALVRAAMQTNCSALSGTNVNGQMSMASTTAMVGGSYQWEVQILNDSTGTDFVIGVCESDAFWEPGNCESTPPPATTDKGWGWAPVDQDLYHGSTTPSGSYGSAAALGNFVSVLFNSTIGELRFAINGVDQGVAFNNLPTDGRQWVFFISVGPTAGVDNGYGWGQPAITNNGIEGYRYPIAGYQKQTARNNASTPIPNSYDFFRSLQGTGADILNVAKGNVTGTGRPGGPTTGFASGLWLIKDFTQAAGWQFVDSVNGNGSALRQTADNTVYSQGAYVAPSAGSLAYCFQTPASGINVQSGFSIVGAGTASGTSVPHGLNGAPDMVWDRALNVYMANGGTGVGTGTQLWSDGVASAQNWTVNATTVDGPGGGSYYCWKAIRGFSAFGHYAGGSSLSLWTGEGSAGPQLNLDFRPALLIIKNTSKPAMPWIVVDSTTNVHNPAKYYVAFNSTAASQEVPLGNDFRDFGIQLYANGAGVLVLDDELNTPGDNYIYMAFAQSPFSGVNVFPANAV